MFERCRPAGRLFYWVLAVVVATWSVRASAGEESSGAKAGKSATPLAAKPAAAEPMPRADRNLLGRFSTQAFSLPRLARTQDYFLRLYDASSPPRYSRHAAALHVDYPL